MRTIILISCNTPHNYNEGLTEMIPMAYADAWSWMIASFVALFWHLSGQWKI